MRSNAQKIRQHFVTDFDTHKPLCFPGSIPDFLLMLLEDELTHEGSLSVCSVSEADWEGGS